MKRAERNYDTGDLMRRLKLANRQKNKTPGHVIYSVLYILGVQVIRCIKRSFRSLKRAVRPVFSNTGKSFAKGRELFKKESENFTDDLRRLRNLIKEESKRGPFAVTAALVKKFFRSFKKHKTFYVRVLNWVAPVAGIAVFVITVNMWNSVTFALAVDYNDKFIGYVQNEKTFENGADMAIGRVTDDDHQFSINRTPKYTLSIVGKNQLSSKEQICDELIINSEVPVVEANGIYIDNKFVVALADKAEITEALEEIKTKFTTDNPTETVNFANEVTVKSGLYPQVSICDKPQLLAKLDEKKTVEQYYTVQLGDAPLSIAADYSMKLSELQSLNPDLDNLMYPDKQVLVAKAQPLLGVKVVRNEKYTRNVAYQTKKLQDSRQYVGYSKTTVKGEAGLDEYEDEVTYIDGVEETRKNVTRVTLKAPVTEEIVVGSKQEVKTSGKATVPSGSYTNSTQAPTGRFIWPVNGGYTSSSWGDGRNHKGMDIPAPKGTAAYAADAGTVTRAGWYSGYGNCVDIAHSNGYVTRYGHLSSINVQVGQKVSQGAVVGGVGATGQAYGNHLHFEIRINDVAQNPANYIGTRGR